MSLAGARNTKIAPKTVRPVPRQLSATRPPSSKIARRDAMPPTPTSPARLGRKAPLKPINKVASAKAQTMPKYRVASSSDSDDAPSRPPAPLPQPGTAHFHDEFTQKIEACTKICAFRDMAQEREAIELKFAALNELAAVIADENEDKALLTDDELFRLFELIESNLWPNSRRMAAGHLYVGGPPLMRDKSWRHMDVIYLLLLRLSRLRVAQELFHQRFVTQLFDLFTTPDMTERQQLVLFFKRYLVFHPADHTFVFKKLCDMIRLHIETQDRPFEVLTALPIVHAILEHSNEPAVSYRSTFETTFLPLLRDKYLEFFYADLSNVLEIFTDRNPENVAKVVRQVLSHWPRTRVAKMCILSVFVIDWIPRLAKDDQKVLLLPMLRIIAENCNSPSPKLAVASLAFFLAPEFDDLMISHSKLMIEVLVPGLLMAAQDNWESTIRERAVLALAIVEKFDTKHFRAVSSQFADDVDCRSKKSQWEAVINACGDEIRADARVRLSELFPEDRTASPRFPF
jgi:hypothetical protein